MSRTSDGLMLLRPILKYHSALYLSIQNLWFSWIFKMVMVGNELFLNRNNA